MVAATTTQQPEVVDSVTDHVTRLSPDDARPYFLYETPDVTSAGSPPRRCDVTRRSGNPSRTMSRDLLTLKVPTLASHAGTGQLRLVGGRMIDRCCSHVAVLPLLPPPPARTCVTWSDAANHVVDDELQANSTDLTHR